MAIFNPRHRLNDCCSVLLGMEVFASLRTYWLLTAGSLPSNGFPLKAGPFLREQIPAPLSQFMTIYNTSKVPCRLCSPLDQSQLIGVLQLKLLFFQLPLEYVPKNLPQKLPTFGALPLSVSQVPDLSRRPEP